MATASLTRFPNLFHNNPSPSSSTTSNNDTSNNTQHQDLPTLRSNYGNPVDTNCIQWMTPTTLDDETPISEIRRRFKEQGYVWIKHLLPREDVLDVREAYFEHLRPTGILIEGGSAREGVFNDAQNPMDHCGIGGPDLPTSNEQLRLLTEAHTMPFYTEFLQHEKLRSFIRTFTGWHKEFMITRNMLRHNPPNGTSTGIHYDQLFLRGGGEGGEEGGEGEGESSSSSEFLTAWIPIGDCAADGGGLAYLKNSTALGRRLEQQFMDRAKTQNMSRKERIDAFNKNMARDGQLSHDMSTFGKDTTSTSTTLDQISGGTENNSKDGDKNPVWLTANYEAGDVVFHNPYMIHGSAKNMDAERKIRLSSDVRFYEEGAKYDKRWMQAWRPDDGL